MGTEFQKLDSRWRIVPDLAYPRNLGPILTAEIPKGSKLKTYSSGKGGIINGCKSVEESNSFITIPNPTRKLVKFPQRKATTADFRAGKQQF